MWATSGYWGSWHGFGITVAKYQRTKAPGGRNVGSRVTCAGASHAFARTPLVIIFVSSSFLTPLLIRTPTLCWGPLYESDYLQRHHWQSDDRQATMPSSRSRLGGSSHQDNWLVCYLLEQCSLQSSDLSHTFSKVYIDYPRGYLLWCPCSSYEH